MFIFRMMYMIGVQKSKNISDKPNPAIKLLQN